MNVIRKDRWLIVTFAEPHIALSWAVQGGGRITTQTIAWYQVKPHELRPPVNAREFLKCRLVENAMPDAVGMLTGADLDAYADVQKKDKDLTSRCIATVGMGNALRVGDPSHDEVRIGTINLLCAVSVPLSYEARVEALSIAVEARTAAVLGAEITSPETGRPATGTGTDCVVIAAPCPELQAVGEPASYAGKHTTLGYLIGKSVFDAVSLGLHRWKKQCLNKEVLV